MDDKISIKISVIIPVYNVEKYLHQCVDSVLNQTYKNLEVILVDDGSKDSSGKICDEYAAKDSRVVVIHKKNGGVSSARNVGISRATGKYIMYVDSDDWLELNAVENCMEVVYKYPTVGCVAFSYVKNYGENEYPKELFGEDKFFLNKEDFVNSFYRRLFGLCNSELIAPELLEALTPCCIKLYRGDLAKSGLFIDVKEIGSCEDGIYNILALKNCDSAIYINKPLYHYRYVKGSITSGYRPDLAAQWQRLFDIMGEEIHSQGLPEEFDESLNNRIALSILGIGMNYMSNEHKSFRSTVKYIKAYIKSDMYRNAVNTVSFRALPLSWRVILHCSKHSFAMGVSAIMYIINFVKTKM